MTELTSVRWWNSPLMGKLHLFAALASIPVLLHLAFEEDVTCVAGVVMFVVVCTPSLIRLRGRLLVGFRNLASIFRAFCPPPKDLEGYQSIQPSSPNSGWMSAGI
jgi:hypothetical protein